MNVRLPHTIADAAEEARAIATARVAARTGFGRAVRDASGLTQIELARLCGVSQPTCSRWESGLGKPRGEAAVRDAAVRTALAALVPEQANQGGAAPPLRLASVASPPASRSAWAKLPYEMSTRQPSDSVALR